MKSGRPGHAPTQGPGRPVPWGPRHSEEYADGSALDHKQQADAYEAHLDELEAELPTFERQLERIEKKRERGMR